VKILFINPSAQNIKKNHISDIRLADKFYMEHDSISQMGLGYLHAVLMKEGHDVFTAEMLIQSLNEKDLEQIIENNHIEIIGFSSYLYNLKSTMQLANSLKRKYPHIFYIAGGYFATLSTELAMKSLSVDCCVIGEGEITIKELVEKLSNNQDWRDVDGIAYKNANKEIIINKPRKLIENLDELPFPNRVFSIVPKLATISSSRGCYGSCNYCSVDSFYKRCKGSKVRRRSPENTIKEIIFLKEKYNFEVFYFVDDNFGMSSQNDRKWFEEFYLLIKEKKVTAQYAIEVRANEVISAVDVLKKFIEIGLKKVVVGAESFSQPQLDFFKKGITVNENIEALRILSSLQLFYKFNVILFDVRSTIGEIIECIKTIKSLDFLFANDDFRVFYYYTLTALDGTAIREYVNQHKLFANNPFYYKFLNSEVTQVHDALENWSNKYNVFFAYEFMHQVSKSVCDNLVTKKIEDLFKNIFNMQLDVILYACTLAQQNMDSSQIINLTNQKFEKYIDEYINEVKALYDIVENNYNSIKR